MPLQSYSLLYCRRCSGSIGRSISISMSSSRNIIIRSSCDSITNSSNINIITRSAWSISIHSCRSRSSSGNSSRSIIITSKRIRYTVLIVF